MKSILSDPMFGGIVLSGIKIVLVLFFLACGAVIIGAVVFFAIKLIRASKKRGQPQPPVVPIEPSTERVCKSCGTRLSPTSSEGLCPQCLMKVGMGSEFTNPDEPQPAPRKPLATDEVAKFFPQLEILELLGQGGMGMVYKARQRQLDRFIALKILLPELSRDPAFAERFNREAKALARLNHPNIVGVYDFGTTGDFYYFVMEYVNGMNLWELERSKKLTPEEALAIVPKICDALQYAHDEGIVHRDIKPGNILIDKKGRVKIADFGLAKLVGKQPQDFHLTQTKMTLGTPHYMAPEQLADPQKVDHRADIYSLGVVFYEMLTGELPMGRFALPSEKVQVDVRLDEVVLRTLQQEPSRRYQHVSEVKTHVENISGVIDKLPPHLRNAIGFDYKSKRTLFGLPLLHVASGVDPFTGKRRTAKGIIAVGDKAAGVISFGGIATGGIAFGGVALGIVPFGGVSLGLISIGGVALGLIASYGGLAIAPIALGGLSVGYYAFGGGAFGIHAMGGNANDPAAKNFFMPWARDSWWVINGTMLVMMFASMAVSFLIPAAVRKKIDGTGNAQTDRAAAPRRGGLVLGCLLTVLFFVLIAVTLLLSYERLGTKPADSVTATSKPNIELSFGSPIERTVLRRDIGTNMFLDLDNDELLTPPTDVIEAITGLYPPHEVERHWQALDIPEASRPYRYLQWLRESSADLMFAGSGKLIAYDCVFAKAHGNSSTTWESWDDLTPQEVRDAVAVVEWGKRARQAQRGQQPWLKTPAAGGIVYPAAQLDSQSPGGPLVNLLTTEQSVLWFFKTSQGSMGVLQIVGFAEDARAAKVRYKLVQSSAGNVPAALKPIPRNVGELLAAMKEYGQRFTRENDMSNTNSLATMQKELATRCNEIKALLKDTIAEPLVKLQDEQLAELKKASQSGDTEKTREMMNAIKATGEQIEKMIEAEFSGPKK
jgi:tRNA A-37 threonylcarbamoyl transferase component Bud32